MKKKVPFGTAVVVIILVAVVAARIWFRATGPVQERVAPPSRVQGGRAPAEAGFEARKEPTPAQEAGERAAERPGRAEEGAEAEEGTQ